MTEDIILAIFLFCVFGVCGIASVLTKKVEKKQEDII